jgi:3-deoxy-manno-octulosonate cytidylyltransferase (CMP-KDO synthetase)
VSQVPFKVVIPARYASSRFPGKPLADLAGKSMVQHVWERARSSEATEVIIATDDQRIVQAARDFGADVAITSAQHQSGTDRVAEVVSSRGWSPDDVVVNVQGDAPLIPSASINRVAKLLTELSGGDLATLSTAVDDEVDYLSRHVVKVVTDQAGRALYFSRSPIPARGHGNAGRPDARRHIGIYAYRVQSLLRLAGTAPCDLERVEQLEQLRALWLGMEIRVAQAPESHGPDVDTPEDLQRAIQWLMERGRRPGTRDNPRA